MKTSLLFRVAGILVFIALVAFLVFEARAWRQERARLKDEISAAQKLVQDAEARQKQRDLELGDTLRQIAQKKASVRTPQQIVRELPTDLPLPFPIQLPPAVPGDVHASTPGASGAGTAQPMAGLPVADLKPLYDFVQDCKSCQAERKTVRRDLTDEQAKSAALAHERDAALKLARGGSFWQRTGRAAKWFGLGVLAGAAAAAAHH
jgi:hypothetical protein